MKLTKLVGIGIAVVFPIAAVISGCGGGGGGGVSTPTPTPTTIPVTALNVPVNFGNGQRGTLNLRVQGSQVSGTLLVAEVGAGNSESTKVFTFRIPAGSYSFSGTFSAPRNFSVTGTFPAPIGTFRINGLLPVLNQQGSFTITANGQTVTGPIPTSSFVPTPTPVVTATPVTTGTPSATGTPNPTGTPSSTPTNTRQPTNTPRATPTPGGNGSADLGFSAISSPNADLSGFGVTSLSGSIKNSGSGQNFISLILNDDSTPTRKRQVRVGITTANINRIRQSQTFTVGNGANASYVEVGDEDPFTAEPTWVATSGELFVDVLTTNRVRLLVRNMQFAPQSSASNPARGTFRITGSADVSNLRIVP